MTTYIIDHERYGNRAEFESLQDAQECLRSCGPEWADTTFRVVGGSDIVDERDEIIGTIEN